MDKPKITYKDAGVDIDKGNEAVERIKPLVKSTYRPEVISDLGGFGGLFALQCANYEEPVLVSGTDGVGTKLKLAFMADRHDTIGIDAVAMCVNDILVSGAEPLFFLDYVAVGSLAPEKLADIVSGVAEGCRQAGCALIGGETAEMPGFYQDGEYDIAGFSVGLVDRKNMIDGTTIADGDVILGLPSSGLHSNGFSLARKLIFEVGGLQMDDCHEKLDGTVGDALLTPTVIYVPAILPLIKENPGAIKGMAHITGGGLSENVPRILPEGLDAVIDVSTWQAPPIFDLLTALGGMDAAECYRTFNMGIGFVLITSPEQATQIQADLQGRGWPCRQIGHIKHGSGQTIIQ